jgi:hypothetical protein
MFCAISFGNLVVGDVEVEHLAKHPYKYILETSDYSLYY